MNIIFRADRAATNHFAEVDVAKSTGQSLTAVWMQTRHAVAESNIQTSAAVVSPTSCTRVAVLATLKGSGGFNAGKANLQYHVHDVGLPQNQT